MDFSAAIGEIARVEKSAIEYAPLKPGKEKVERLLEVSPPNIHEMEYEDIVNQYARLEKIIRVSSRMDMGLGGIKAGKAPEAQVPAILKKEAKAIEKEMKKISTESAKESKEIAAAVQVEPEARPPISGPAIERARAEEAAKMLPEVAHEPAHIQETVSIPSPPKEVEEEGKEEAKEVAPPPEITPVPEEIAPALPGEAPAEFKPVPEKEPGPISLPEPEPAPIPEAIPAAPRAPPEEVIEEGEQPALQIILPPILATSPLENAEKTIIRLETQLGAQMTGKTTKKVDTKDTKKRMMELTRELFKERSMNRRAEIKKEIVALRAFLTESKGGKAVAGGLPKGSLFAAVKTEQEYELRDAKNKIQQIYEENQKRILSTMIAQRAVEHRGPAFETFSTNMVELEQRIIFLIEKYQVFLTAEHTAELSKLMARGQATDESKNLKAKIKEIYSHDFSSLKESIGEEIHSQLDTTRAALFEDAGDPQAVKLAQIANAPEETLFNLLQAKDSRTYEKYARGEIDRSEALLIARKFMAQEAGIDEDTIIKCFGNK